ncbi:MAG: aldose 1-epimerase family protein [Planctomycetaceae bacterium]|nr:aldose 1-epimerase family protein [Planctomycetaceae bacterium]
MPTEKYVLTDVANQIWQESMTLPSASGQLTGNLADCSIHKQTLKGGRSAGVELIEIDNGHLKISLLPTRGMGILKVKAGETDFSWSSPVKQPVNPAFVNLQERDGLGWLSGFNEMMCRCGLMWHGAPEKDPKTGEFRTLHGRIANLPAHYVDVETSNDAEGLLKVTGLVDEAMLFWPALQLKSTLSTTPGSSTFTVEDTIINNGGTAQQFEILYHTNFGVPLLEEGARLVMTYDEVSPRDDWASEDMSRWTEYIAPEPGRPEQCYFVKPGADSEGQARALLRNRQGTLAAGLEWSVKELPWFTQWKNEQSVADGYCTGLEPGTSFPNPHSYEREQGRLITLEPGESCKISLKFSFYTNAEQVSKAEHQITATQEHIMPKVHQTPIALHSPAAG